MRRHNRRVVVSLLARGLPLDRAQDFAQEAWSRLVEQQASGKLSRLELPGLAIAQARFVALTHARKASQRIEEALAGPVAVPSAEDGLLRREQIVAIERALDACSPSSRRIFMMVYENPGMPHAAAAEVVGLSVQRVRQILCEVRKKLRAAAEGEP